MCELSSTGGKNKASRKENAANKYLTKVKALQAKLVLSKSNIMIKDELDLSMMISLEHFMALVDIHIDLVERRFVKGEKIPHEEKMFSIFEDYTEWITKGELHPYVELG